MASDVVLHVSADPDSERVRLAIRFGLVALAEHLDVTILLSAGAVALAASQWTEERHAGHRSVAGMVATFLDNGGNLCVLGGSALDHDLRSQTLIAGAAIVSPGWVVDELVSASATLTL